MAAGTVRSRARRRARLLALPGVAASAMSAEVGLALPPRNREAEIPV